MEAVRATIRQYIEDNFIMGARPAPLADGSSFLDEHILDSTGFLELIAFLEETYGVRVSDEEMLPENLDSVDNVVAFLARKQPG